MTAYPHLFTPLRLGPVTARNRILQTAHSKHFSHGGVDTRRDLHYHVARAKGGAALLITGNRFVHPTSSVAARAFPRGYLQRGVEFDRIMTGAVHEHGALIVAQLNHGGVNGSSDAPDDLRYLVAPSAIRSPMFGEAARAMEHGEIQEVTRWWGRSAALAREGGFDGVEIHVSHTYLLHQFLSPVYNRREDEYGGSLTNRLRFAREVIDEVRRQVGPDFMVGVRLPMSDFAPGGLGPSDAVQIACILDDQTAIDYINVTGGGYHEGLAHAFSTADVPDGWLLDIVSQVKAAVSRVPVFAVGGLRDVEEAERILTAGIADMVAMTRALIADPDLPNKAREGREREIYRCIRANQGCVSRTWRGLPMGCTVNPTVGREAVFGPLISTETPRHWAVVGGGPAGMKAAETLAKRGHRVTLLEQSDALGGQLRLVVKTPGREGWRRVIEDLTAQMELAGVEVRLKTPATAGLLRQMSTDDVILATGSLADRSGSSMVAPLVAAIPGAEQAHVITLREALDDSRPIGEHVVVLDDLGTRATAGVAEVLLDAGKEVTVVTRWNALFPDTSHTLDMGILYGRLFNKGLRSRTNVWCRRIGERNLTIYNLYSEELETLDGVDTVVLATGPHPNDALFHELSSQFSNLHRVGDCLVPRQLDHAIYEGYLAGLERFSTEERFMLEGTLDLE